MNNSWMNNPMWLNMDAGKKAVIEGLMKNGAGKGVNDSAALIMAAMSGMKKNNMSFSKEEADILIEAMTGGMSPEEKARVVMMKSFIKNR